MVSLPSIGKKKEDPVEKFWKDLNAKKITELKTDEKLIKFNFYDEDPDTGMPIVKQEKAEVVQHKTIKTDFPPAAKRLALAFEFPELNVEQIYYWFIKFYREFHGMDKVIKITDNLSTSVASSLFGNMQARLSAQQNQASQYLKGVSDMVKGLFQLVREIRIIDDRLQYYYDTEAKNPANLTDEEKKKQKGRWENRMTSEIVLKGFWIDQVEGGTKNPTSVYGMASQVGFTVLPDLFFAFTPKSKLTIDSEIEQLNYNRKVREVLGRKIRQYYEWKERTKLELMQRRDFELKYMRQHYDTIRLYISWIKPYLKNVRRLQLNEKNMGSANIVNSFETNLIEIETLFVRDDFHGFNGVISLHIMYRVKPELAYHSYEYQNKGPIHVGRADITLRGYAWDDKTLKNYQDYRNAEEIELISSIDESIKAAVDALGDSLMDYLREAGEKVEGPVKKEEKKAPASSKGALEPFIALAGGFKETFGAMLPSKPKKKKADPKDEFKKEKNKHHAEHFVQHAIFEGVYRYKQVQHATYW